MTDTCGVCNRPLLDPESRAAGIGPKCAEKFHGSRAAAGSHQLTFEEHDMTEPKPTGRCGNDPRTVLTPGDQAAVTQFTEYLARRRRAFSAVTADEPETEEQRADRKETERAHEAGDHEHCGPTCEVEFPSDMLRNTILYAALPGSARMLDELLRRATTEAEQDAERFKADHLAACRTIAEMHEAATGRAGMGPIRGVVEDVADVRARAERVRDAARLHRQGLISTSELYAVIEANEAQQPPTPCGHCAHPADWHDEHEGCVGPTGIGGLGSGDCTCTRSPRKATEAQQPTSAVTEEPS